MSTRFWVEQITSVLQQVTGGVPVSDVCWQVGYPWKKQYGGLLPSEARELKQLRDENTRLKRLVGRSVARQGHAPGCTSKKVLKPVKQREVMDYVTGRYGVSVRRACRVIQATRSSAYYVSRKDRSPGSGSACARDLAQTRVRFGYRRLLVLMRREGWDVGKERFYRVYTEESLALRRKRPWRHATAVHREQRRPGAGRDDIWSMDFVTDQLVDGRGFRTLTVIDRFTRECLAFDAGYGRSGRDVVAALERLRFERGLPQRIYLRQRATSEVKETELL